MENKKKKKTITIVTIIVLLIVAVALIMKVTGKKEVTLNTTTAQQKTIELTVMATGYVQPVDKVDVGTQVSGVIEKIYVDYNSIVKQGDLLAELDKQTLQEKVVQAKASLASAESDSALAQINHDRTKRLYEANAATKVAYEEAVNKLAQAKTAYANAKANLQQAEVNYEYAEIRSPINGVILDRAVNTGQTVAASFNTPTLFTIAEDLTKMQVEADIDEADIGRIAVGQKVIFTVDAYNDLSFEGTVNQLRLQPTVTNNVVTYTVIIEAPNPDQKLFPGMTANITIITDSQTGLTVPVEALNFNPSAEIMEMLNIQSGNPQATPEKKNRVPQNQNSKNAEQQTSTVWVRNNGFIEPKNITTGINDGVDVIVSSGLKEGDEIVLSASVVKKAKGQPTSIMPGPGGRRR